MSDIHFHAMGPSRARTGEDPLVPFLLGAMKAPVTISARDVHRIDSHRLQILLVAQRKWVTDGVGFAVTDMAPAFRDGLERLGLNPDYFDKETPQ